MPPANVDTFLSGLTGLDPAEGELVAAAFECLHRNFTPEKHTVGAAVRTASGKIYTGMNIKVCAYGPCAETIAVGSALSAGDRELRTIVAVRNKDGVSELLPPCGNCRQLLIDYGPGCVVLMPGGGEPVVRQTIRELMPGPYLTRFT